MPAKVMAALRKDLNPPTMTELCERIPVQRRCRDPVEAENPPSCRAYRQRDNDNSTYPALLYKFVHAPGSIHWPCKAVPSLLELRHLTTHPTKNRRVRHDNTALGHHRLEIPIAQSVGDVPAHTQLDDLGIEPAPS